MSTYVNIVYVTFCTSNKNMSLQPCSRKCFLLTSKLTLYIYIYIYIEQTKYKQQMVLLHSIANPTSSAKKVISEKVADTHLHAIRHNCCRL